MFFAVMKNSDRHKQAVEFDKMKGSGLSLVQFAPFPLFSSSPLLLLHSQVFHQEAVDVGLFFDDFGGRFACAVSGFGFDAN